MLETERLRLGGAARRVFVAAAVLGVVGVAAGWLLSGGGDAGRARFAHAYLLNYAWVLSLALGALWFVPLQHLTRSSWSVVVRRLAEHVSATLPLLLVLGLPLLFMLPDLYPWADAAHAADDHLIAHKAPYLNPAFFAVRLVGYFAVWILLASLFRRWSIRQDETGDPALTLRSERLSGPALLIYGVTVTLAAFDLLMSLDPHWFSTIFGVYYFAGVVVAFFALMTLLTFMLQRAGMMRRVVTIEHYNDYGRAMFAFVFFWAYIAFSQYMLIWYANIPEETVWFLRRQSHGWERIGLVLVLAHWLAPFAGLMSRFTKRRVRLMVFWAVWILAVHWIDMVWLVMPELSPEGVMLGAPELALLVGLGGLWVAALALALGDRPLVPLRDPRMAESLNFENY